MPYSRKQCKAFGAKSSRGERVPRDWKRYCTVNALRKYKKKKR